MVSSNRDPHNTGGSHAVATSYASVEPIVRSRLHVRSPRGDARADMPKQSRTDGSIGEQGRRSSPGTTTQNVSGRRNPGDEAPTHDAAGASKSGQSPPWKLKTPSYPDWALTQLTESISEDWGP